jgi:hypothetical protein
VNLFVIGYVHQVEGLDYPERYDVFVVAASLADALDNSDIYKVHEADTVNSVAHTSVPPVSKLRFTNAVRSALAFKTPAAAHPEMDDAAVVRRFNEMQAKQGIRSGSQADTEGKASA